MSFREFRNDGYFARTVTWAFPNKTLETPVYFPSISSSGTDKVLNHVKFLMKANYPCMLISAYDFFHSFESQDNIVKKINRYPTTGKFLLVDSGGYEIKWNDDYDWDFDMYCKTMHNINADFYTSLDLMEPMIKQKKFDRIIKSYTIRGGESQFLPIFDGDSQQLVTNIKEFLTKHQQYSLKFLSVRERDLGVSIIQKASTIYKIRQLIDQYGNKQLLHILGCGDPLSMALYTYYGADSFDSRDWHRKTIDVPNLTLCDFSHLDLLKCKCEACTSEVLKTKDISKTLAHNLIQYSSFIKKLQNLIRENKLKEFLISKKITTSVMKSIQSW